MKYAKSHYIRWTVLLLFLVGVWMFRLIPGAGEWYARQVYPEVSFLLSGVASAVPFSLCEMTVLGFLLFVCVYPFIAKRRRKSWFSVVRTEVEVVLWTYVWFYWSWGMNYFRDDFFTRSEVVRVAYDEGRFHRFIYAYADSLNATYRMWHPMPEEEVREEVKRIYKQVPAQFGLAAPQAFQQPKYLLFNSLYSKVGVLGYMGPFFDESHVNHDLLPLQYPFTYAHELSHLLGVASEAEANLWAYGVCIRSAYSCVRYCGYMGLLPYIYADARRILDAEEFEAWTKHLAPEVMRMRNEQAAYWRERYSPLLGKMQDAVYHLYLKGNRIPSGKKNYGEVVGMLLALPEHAWE